MKFFILALLLLSALALGSDADSKYQVCTMNHDSDIICNTRDQMHLYLQYIASNDLYSRKQMDAAGYCGPTFAKDIKEIRKYDAVNTPIFTDNGVKYIKIAWVKIQIKMSDTFNDFFMATNFLTCK